MNGQRGDEGGADLWVWLGILRARLRLALLAGGAAGLLVYVLYGLWAARVPTIYAADFAVRYRAGTNLMAGLASLVGRDLPSLSNRSTLETQMDILASLKPDALRRMPAHQGLSAEELAAEGRHYTLSVRTKPNTDIIEAVVRGEDRDKVREFAEALLRAYQHNDTAELREKNRKTKDYTESECTTQKGLMEKYHEELLVHRAIEPLEASQTVPRERIEAASEAFRREGRKRRDALHALLGKYTDEHPRVVAAQGAVDALGAIVQALEAQDRAALQSLQLGAEAQWVGLALDTLEDRDRLDAIAREIEHKRAGISSDREYVKAEYELARSTWMELRTKLKSLELTENDNSSNVTPHREPSIRAERPGGQWRWTLTAALLCGLLTPFCVEALVVTLRTVDDLERASGLPCLAALPRLDPGEHGDAPILARGSAGSDELRLLRTNVESALDYPGRRLILIAGAEPGEGKSVVAVNLAAVYAEMGIPTLLVDLDLRRPTVHELLKLRRSPGVVDAAQESVTWKRAVQIPGVDNLHVLAAGSPVDDSGGVLATVRLAELLSEMREVFSVVICDSPALTAVADASLVARQADAVVLVYALASTPHRSFSRTLSMLATAKAKVLGVVANDKRGLSSRRAYRYRYYREHRRAAV